MYIQHKMTGRRVYIQENGSKSGWRERIVLAAYVSRSLLNNNTIEIVTARYNPTFDTWFTSRGTCNISDQAVMYDPKIELAKNGFEFDDIEERKE